MIFSELYSVYYNTVAEILKAAIDHPLGKNELRRIVEERAFGESILNIEPSLTEGRWQLLKRDGTTPIQSVPSMPLTMIQKRWLKAISLDSRIRLFQDELIEFPDVEPLFTEEDICIFDKYADGDNYRDGAYIKNFRQILDAIRNRYPLSIDVLNRRGHRTCIVLMPEYLEYSEKDDKFRLIGSGCRLGRTVNLGRIIRCERYTGQNVIRSNERKRQRPRSVQFELVDQRNALERVLMHFAHFEKQAEQIGDQRYKITIYYDKDDETEMVIRILSFGPMVKVTAPVHFINLIRERLIQQKSCGL
ncbi:WYL domain-containing protein [Frisingicoccus sp.]|uniref:WYL domain-containing protein n=1 Tax=Frisingicoccus sp. TaxID=1918627 RepID=UPI003AB8D92D